jgi:uncharacterized membrane protein YkvA (DUF1232 family)
VYKIAEIERGRGVVARWRGRAREIKRDTLALYLACRRRDTPWYAKLVGVAVVAYALSPLDLIPDFVPLLGYLDDLILLPIGIFLTVKLIPAPILAECRIEAQAMSERPTNRAAAAMILAVWAVAAFVVIRVGLDLAGIT